MSRVVQSPMDELDRQVQTLEADLGHPPRPVCDRDAARSCSFRHGRQFRSGAVLVDATGTIVERGRNRVFFPHFRSDLHAEMDLISRVEENLKGSLEPRELTLFSSLEPCPTCLLRLIISGVGRVFYAALDGPDGMANRLDAFPPEWRQMAGGREFGPADCSPRLQDLAWRVFEATVHVNDRKLMERSRTASS